MLTPTHIPFSLTHTHTQTYTHIHIQAYPRFNSSTTNYGLYKIRSRFFYDRLCKLLTISIWQPMASKSAESWTIFNIAPAIAKQRSLHDIQLQLQWLSQNKRITLALGSLRQEGRLLWAEITWAIQDHVSPPLPLKKEKKKEKFW